MDPTKTSDNPEFDAVLTRIGDHLGKGETHAAIEAVVDGLRLLSLASGREPAPASSRTAPTGKNGMGAVAGPGDLRAEMADDVILPDAPPLARGHVPHESSGGTAAAATAPAEADDSNMFEIGFPKGIPAVDLLAMVLLTGLGVEVHATSIVFESENGQCSYTFDQKATTVGPHHVDAPLFAKADEFLLGLTGHSAEERYRSANLKGEFVALQGDERHPVTYTREPNPTGVKITLLLSPVAAARSDVEIGGRRL